MLTKKDTPVFRQNRISQNQHGPEASRTVVNKFREVKDIGGDRDDVIKILRQLGELAAQRR